MSDTFISVNTEEFTRGLMLTAEEASLGAREIVSKGGDIIARFAKKQFISVAGGRNNPPTLGRPTLRTGNLQKSIQRRQVRLVGPATWKSWTGPSEIYGPRVEFGFSGTDSRGRVYGPPRNPAKYPYMEPGVKQSEPYLENLARDVWAKVGH